MVKNSRNDNIRTKRASIIASLLSLVLAGLAPSSFAETALTMFPGAVSKVPAARTGLTVAYRFVREDEEGRRYLLTIGDALRKPLFRMIFYRNDEVAWSPDGQYLIINHNWGSNIADCRIFSPNYNNRYVSLTYVWSLRPGTPADEQPNSAHFYMNCLGWTSDGRVKVELSGHSDIDAPPISDFHYSYIYDPRSIRLSRTKPWPVRR